MKVEQRKPEFIPVTITLETQDEVDMLLSLIGSISGVNIVRGKLINPLLENLRPFGDNGAYKDHVKELISISAKF